MLWETAEFNCLTKAVAISKLRARDLQEKVIDSLGGVSARLPLRDLIMLHRCESCICVSMIQWFGSISVYWSFSCVGFVR